MFVLFKWKYIGGHKNIQIVIVAVSSYFICDVKENGGKNQRIRQENACCNRA